MRQLLFVLLPILLGVSPASAAIQWKFYSDNNDTIILNATIGTPPQPVRLVVQTSSYYAALEVPSTNVTGGIFNPNASTTFVKTGDTHNFQGQKDGIVGTDTFTIGDGVVEKSEPFRVQDIDWYFSSYGTIGTGRPSDGTTSFIQAVVKSLEEPVLVITYDVIGFNYTQPTTGTITLGGRPDFCSKKWTTVPEVRYFDANAQWAVKIDDLTVGKYSVSDPGETLISIHDKILSFPETTYSSVLNALGATGGSLPCDVKTEIVFSIGGIDFKVGPDTYLGRDEARDECYFNADERFGSTNYILPVSILKDRCLLYDYKNLQVGFADRV